MSDYNKKNLVEIMNDQGVPIIKTIRADAVSASPALPAEYKRLSRKNKKDVQIIFRTFLTGEFVFEFLQSPKLCLERHPDFYEILARKLV